MRKNNFVALIIALGCIFSITISVCAVESRASDQINIYGMEVTPVTGTLNVKFSVTGTGVVNKIGCQSIYVYEKSGSNWIYSTDWNEEDDGMSRYNTHVHKNTIYYNSEAGTEYKVVVTIFAENDAGRDTRTKVFFVTGR